MLKSPPKALRCLLLTVIAFVLLTGCSHTDPNAPAETQLDTLLSPPVSVLAVPVHYKMSELEAMVNEKLKGSFIRKHIPISKREDSLYIEVSRRGGITLSRDGHTLYYTVPLRIKGTYKAKVAGIRITNSKPVEADVTLDLATFLSLDERWELVTRSEVKAIHWVNDPVLDLGVLKLNLRHPLEKMLTEKEGELMSIADRSLDKLIDTRKIVKKLWMDLQKPILVNKKKKNVWIKAYGVDLAGVLENDDPEILSLRVQLKALMQTMLNKDQEKPSNPELPAFKRPENQNDSLLVYLHAVIPFKEVNEFLEGEFRNKELAAKGFATRIKNIRMYGTDKGIAVELKVKGDVDGVLYAEGVPVYDPVKRVIALKDFGFSVHSENMLLNSADWLLHSDALDALNGKLEYQVDQLVGKLPDLISQGIEKGKSGNKVNVNIARLQVAPYTIITTKSNIQIILAASGKADIELEKQVFSGKKKRQ